MSNYTSSDTPGSEFDLTPLRSALSDLASQGRTALLPALHAAQALYGHLPEPVAAEVGRLLRVPLADVHGVIEFYSLFYPQPVGKTILQVCTDPSCELAGGEQVLQAVCRHLGVGPGETSRRWRVHRRARPLPGTVRARPGAC